MSSSHDEISSREKRINSKRPFTRDSDDFTPGWVLSQYEVSYVNTEEITFYKGLLLLLDFFNRYVVAFFERQRFKRIMYFMRYVHNNSTMLIPKFQNKADYVP